VDFAGSLGHRVRWQVQGHKRELEAVRHRPNPAAEDEQAHQGEVHCATQGG
jgi:hypothetical protein